MSLTDSSRRAARSMATNAEPTAPVDEIASLVARLLELIASRPEPTASEALPPSSKVLLTIEEAALRLGIGRTKEYALFKSGELASVQIGRLRRIHVQAIDQYTADLSGTVDSSTAA